MTACVCPHSIHGVVKPHEQRESVRPPLPLLMFMYTVNALLLCAQPTVLYYTAYVGFALLGNLLSPFFFAFHLMDLVHRQETLRAVVRAVTYNGKQLTTTVLLVAVIIFLFSIIEFLIVREFSSDVSRDDLNPLGTPSLSPCRSGRGDVCV